MTTANYITSIRIAVIPFFIFFFAEGKSFYALAIFAFAGATDLIDGSIARFLKQPSSEGAFLDPMADKLLMQTCYICLLAAGILPLWFFLLAFGRDLMIVSGIFYLRRKISNLTMRAIVTSKISTGFQLLLAIVGLVLWWKPSAVLYDHYLLADFFKQLAVITALSIGISGILYIRLGRRLLKECPPKK